MEFPRYIAHRGLHGDGLPENSLAAFAKAVEKGVAVQFEVRFTADRRMVVFGDDNAWRMCGIDCDICDTDYETLRTLRLDATDEHIPLLAEVLRLIGGRVAVFIQLENCGRQIPDAEKRLAHMMKKYSGDFAVQSFDPMSLCRLRNADPEIVRGQLVSTYGEKGIMRSLAATKPVWKALSKPQYIACDLRSVTLESAFYAADIDAHFMTWTANTEELMTAAEQFSGSVIFENIAEDYFNGK
jgi:glycerophosphoryl diester phosphodiesterase